MVRFKSSRGFVMPIMIAGFVLVGLLAAVGIINLFKTPNVSSKTASQSIQGEGSVQKISANTIPDDPGDQPPPVQKYNWAPFGPICVPIPFFNGGYPTKESCEKKFGSCHLNGNPNQTITPCVVDESVPNVKIQINNIPKPKEKSPIDPNEYALFACLKSSLKNCGKSDWFLLPVKDDSFLAEKICGDGAKGLKGKCNDDGTDWFHAGSTYRIFIAQGQKTPVNGFYPGLETIPSQIGNVLLTVSFYASHFYPHVISPINSAAAQAIELPGSNITDIQNRGSLDIPVRLQGRNIKGGLKPLIISTNVTRGALSDPFNVYYIQVLAHDSNYVFPTPNKDGKNSPCLYVAATSHDNPPDPRAGLGEFTVHLPFQNVDENGDEVDLTEGSYILRIIEGNGGFPDHTKPICSPGKFVYYDIPFSIADGKDITGKSNLGLIAPPIPDPYKTETGVSEVAISPKPICDKSQQKNGYCTSIPTAIGPISTEPGAFIGSIFSIVLSIGGIAAFGFFIQAGYKLMTSAGNKEKVGAAREQITAAIMGLLFIILSITILEFIGINILHIPGFK